MARTKMKPKNNNNKKKKILKKYPIFFSLFKPLDKSVIIFRRTLAISFTQSTIHYY